MFDHGVVGSWPVPATAAACVDELAHLERLKAAICARQARLAVRLDELSPSASPRGVAAQVALARSESPHRARRLLGLAHALHTSLPRTAAALAAGEINEHRAELIAREGADLPPADQLVYDRLIHHPDHPDSPDSPANEPDVQPDADSDENVRPLGPSALAGAGDLDVTDTARRVAMRLDDTAATDRHDRARTRRRLTTRRLGDNMMALTAILPDTHATAIMTTLHRTAATTTTAAAGVTTASAGVGELAAPRTVAQVACDLFVARLLTPTPAAGAGAGAGAGIADGPVPLAVHIDLLIPATTLLADGTEPAELLGCGPIPAQIARRLIHASPQAATTIRRLFATPTHLVAMESTSRRFTGLLRRFIELRDRRCRTPYCNAPIRHLDHIHPARHHGPTTAQNGQGLCTTCNLTKEDPGWTHTTSHPSGPPDTTAATGPHAVTITTPTGHTHTSHAPTPPGPPATAPLATAPPAAAAATTAAAAMAAAADVPPATARPDAAPAGTAPTAAGPAANSGPAGGRHAPRLDIATPTLPIQPTAAGKTRHCHVVLDPHLWAA